MRRTNQNAPQAKKKVGRPPAPEPHVGAPTKSVVDFVLRTRKPAPKKDE